MEYADSHDIYLGINLKNPAVLLGILHVATKLQRTCDISCLANGSFLFPESGDIVVCLKPNLPNGLLSETYHTEGIKLYFNLCFNCLYIPCIVHGLEVTANLIST